MTSGSSGGAWVRTRRCTGTRRRRTAKQLTHVCSSRRPVTPARACNPRWGATSAARVVHRASLEHGRAPQPVVSATAVPGASRRPSLDAERTGGADEMSTELSDVASVVKARARGRQAPASRRARIRNTRSYRLGTGVWTLAGAARAMGVDRSRSSRDKNRFFAIRGRRRVAREWKKQTGTCCAPNARPEVLRLRRRHRITVPSTHRALPPASPPEDHLHARIGRHAARGLPERAHARSPPVRVAVRARARPGAFSSVRCGRVRVARMRSRCWRRSRCAWRLARTPRRCTWTERGR